MTTPLLQHLKNGLILCKNNFPTFVQTFNWLVNRSLNLKGDADVQGAKSKGFITVDNTDSEHPVIRFQDNGLFSDGELNYAGDADIKATYQLSTGEYPPLTKSIRTISAMYWDGILSGNESTNVYQLYNFDTSSLINPNAEDDYLIRRLVPSAVISTEISTEVSGEISVELLTLSVAQHYELCYGKFSGADRGCFRIVNLSNELEEQDCGFANRFFQLGGKIGEVENTVYFSEFINQGELSDFPDYHYTDEDNPYVFLKVDMESDDTGCTTAGTATLEYCKKWNACDTCVPCSEEDTVNIIDLSKDLKIYIKPLYKLTHEGAIEIDYRNMQQLAAMEV